MARGDQGQPAGKKLKLTFVRSTIGRPERQRRTIRALGLRKLGDTVVREDSPSLRGMVHAVRHLLEVQEIDE